MKQNRENPFFETYRTPFGTPPFDQIETEQYEPAFDEGIWQLTRKSEPLPTIRNFLHSRTQS